MLGQCYQALGGDTQSIYSRTDTGVKCITQCVRVFSAFSLHQVILKHTTLSDSIDFELCVFGDFT